MNKFLFTLAALLAATSSQATELAFSAAGRNYSVPVTSMKEARFKATLRQQYDFSCGSAAIATLLTYQYGRPVSEQDVFQTMFTQGDQQKIRREGFSLLDMKRYLASHGFSADGFTQPLDKLVHARLPAIALINEKGYHHFVVIKGIRNDHVLIGDPSSGTRVMERNRFEAMWVNKILFVIYNRQEQARFNQAADWNAAPMAPVGDGVRREGLDIVTLPKLGTSDF